MQCDVTDLQGNHCPEGAVHTVMFKGVETHLCERCHANVLAGAYGSRLTQRPPDAGDSASFLNLLYPIFNLLNQVRRDPPQRR